LDWQGQEEDTIIMRWRIFNDIGGRVQTANRRDTAMCVLSLFYWMFNVTKNKGTFVVIIILKGPTV